MAEAQASNPFGEGLVIERSDEPMPKRIVAGRESIPNPFIDAVRDSYAESLDPKVGQDKAVRAINVPVDKKGVTVRTVTRKVTKNGKTTITGTQFQQHTNITTALYLLRQAAIKNDCGVRIVVDYDKETVPTVTTKVDDKDVTLTDVTLNKFRVKDGKVRVRFLGQKKKEAAKDSKKSDEENAA